MHLIIYFVISWLHRVHVFIGPQRQLSLSPTNNNYYYTAATSAPRVYILHSPLRVPPKCNPFAWRHLHNIIRNDVRYPSPYRPSLLLLRAGRYNISLSCDIVSLYIIIYTVLRVIVKPNATLTDTKRSRLNIIITIIVCFYYSLCKIANTF